MKELEHAFGKNDIRGIYGKDITEELFYNTALGYTKWIAKQTGKAIRDLRISVCMDARLHSPSLKDALINGLMDSKVGHIEDLGLAPTPIGYYSEFAHNLDGAMIITASHNPSEYNGMKMTYNRQSLNESQIKEVKEMTFENWKNLPTELETYNFSTEIIPEYTTEMKEKFGKVCLYTCENKSSGSGVLSGKLRHEKGEEYSEGEMLGVKFTLSPDSFFQINEKTAERIYSDVTEIIRNSSAEKVIDCFSGIGITSALFAKSGKEVTSVEIVPSAVRDAKRIGALNGLSGHISYLCGDAAKLLFNIENVGNSLFFVDPPRGGLGAKTALMITNFKPKEIIYLSCNPKTLKEDLKTIIENGYKITSATPYDLFPETKHIEALVVFTRKV
mgnify:CR=1 FL=1